MIIAFWCVLVAAMLPLGCSYLAKYGSTTRPVDGGSTRFDNHEPRSWLATQTGFRARADAAQANGFEAFPFFAAGVVIAVLQHVPVATIDRLAMVFVIARVAYIAFYVADRPQLRSPVWLIGFLATVALYVFASFGSLR